MRPLRSLRSLACLCLAGAAASSAAQNGAPMLPGMPDAQYARALAMPPVKAADGFGLSVLVPTLKGLYDPFDLHVADAHTLWVADDARTGAILKLSDSGRVSTLVRIRSHAPISLDVAPPSFGKYAGQIYTVAFAKPNKAGGWELPNAITRIDPATGHESVVCFLPENQAHEHEGGGFFARFGPEGSPFAGRLWVTAASNHTIYTVQPDDSCKPFLVLDLQKWGSPRGIGFTPDGNTLLLGSAAPAPANRAKTTAGGGRVLRLSADGGIAAQPFVGGLHEPGAMAFAPAGFGAYGGQLFISDAGDWNNEVEDTDPIPADGCVYRVTPDGRLVPVATGLANPVGVAFLGNILVVSDINNDYHVGKQKLADGFVVTIKAQ